jgi:hypothetical protein
VDVPLLQGSLPRRLAAVSRQLPTLILVLLRIGFRITLRLEVYCQWVFFSFFLFPPLEPSRSQALFNILSTERMGLSLMNMFGFFKWTYRMLLKIFPFKSYTSPCLSRLCKVDHDLLICIMLQNSWVTWNVVSLTAINFHAPIFSVCLCLVQPNINSWFRVPRDSWLSILFISPWHRPQSKHRLPQFLCYRGNYLWRDVPAIEERCLLCYRLATGMFVEQQWQSLLPSWFWLSRHIINVFCTALLSYRPLLSPFKFLQSRHICYPLNYSL